MKNRFNLCRILLLAIALVSTMATLTSCGDDDEPKGQVINYYIEVEEQFLVDGSTDHTDRFYNPVTLMKEAILKAYPTPTATGNDEVVINACNESYLGYIANYDGYDAHLTCLIHLVKAVTSGDIVKQTEYLRTYQYDINPGPEQIVE